MEAKYHAVSDKRRFRMRRGEAHGAIVNFINGGNQAAELQTFEVGITAVGDVMVRMIHILLAQNEKITSSALKSRVGVNSLLLWNFTPLRRWKV